MIVTNEQLGQALRSPLRVAAQETSAELNGLDFQTK